MRCDPTLLQVAPPTSARRALARDDGFALITVIFIVSLLASAAFIATTAARSRLRAVEADLAVAQAQAAADTGFAITLRAMLQHASTDAPSQSAQSVTRCRINATSRVSVIVTDEAARIDLNLASPDLLRALMIGLGWSADLTQKRLDALADYVDSDDDTRPLGAEARDYSHLKRAGRPRNAPLKAVEELGQIVNFDVAAVLQILPHVTVHSGMTGIDSASASQLLLAILDAGERGQPFDGNAAATSASNRLAPNFRSQPSGSTKTVTATGLTETGAMFVRDALVTVPSRRQPQSTQADFRILRWRQGEAPLDDVGSFGEASWPQC